MSRPFRAPALEAANDLLEETRTAICQAIRREPAAILGASSWLAHAIQEQDIRFDSFGDDGIWFHGMCFTSQTQGLEDFDGHITWEQLDG